MDEKILPLTIFPLTFLFHWTVFFFFFYFSRSWRSKWAWPLSFPFLKIPSPKCPYNHCGYLTPELEFYWMHCWLKFGTNGTEYPVDIILFWPSLPHALFSLSLFWKANCVDDHRALWPLSNMHCWRLYEYFLISRFYIWGRGQCSRCWKICWKIAGSISFHIYPLDLVGFVWWCEMPPAKEIAELGSSSGWASALQCEL